MHPADKTGPDKAVKDQTVTMISRIGMRPLLLLLPLLLSSVASAGLIRMESESYLSARAGFFDSKFELPMNEFMAGSYQSDDKRLSMTTNFSAFIDPKRLQTDPSQRDAHLYTGDINYEVVKNFFKFRVGRSFDTHYSIGANTMDAAAGEFSLFESRLHFGGFYGVERLAEHQDYETTNTIGGANLRFTEADMYPWTLTGKFQERFFTVTPALKNERLTELAIAKPFNLAWNPTVLADSTWNIDDSHLDRFDFSADFYPEVISLIRLRATSVEIRKNIYPTTPIFSIFSAGRLYEGLIILEKQFNNQFNASLSMAYDNFQSSFSRRQGGYRGEFETRYTPRVYGLTNVIYYFNSYGGNAIGDRVRLSQKVNLQNEFYQEGDLTHYDKITQENRFATHLETGFSHWFADRFKLNTFGEYNNNNFLQYDFRVGLKLTYLLWTETS